MPNEVTVRNLDLVGVSSIHKIHKACGKDAARILTIERSYGKNELREVSVRRSYGNDGRKKFPRDTPPVRANVRFYRSRLLR